MCRNWTYRCYTSVQWSNNEFKIDLIKDGLCTFTVMALEPDSKYNFRVQTKNAEGWSEPSDPKEGDTSTLPPIPTKPNPPILTIDESAMYLIAVVPEGTCSKNAPIVSWMMSGFSANKEKVEKYYEVHENDFMASFNRLAISELNLNHHYELQILAKNETGWSEPSEKFNINFANPHVPQNLRVSSKTTDSLIKLRWEAPLGCLVTHYEIMMRRRKGVYNDSEKPIKLPAEKLSATFTNLKHNTHYCFKIRGCNGQHYTSVWSEEIEANTQISKVIKAVASPAVWAAGTVAAPITITVLGGLLGGVLGADAGEKVGTVTAGVGAVAARTAGMVGGAALGIVGAPLFGAAAAHVSVHGDDALSDQSDDKDAFIMEC